jgi:hypothetical protein
MYNPISGEIHQLSNFIPASVASSVLPALVYGVGMRVLGRRENLRAPAPGSRRLISPNI